jgi:glycosyltransferase involved in cell wall biosynthesis
METDYARMLRKQVGILGLHDRVSLNGPLPHEALPDVYMRSDLFILPSEYESYPMVLAEALVHGIPVIAAEAGGIPELVPEGAGLFFHAGNTDSLKEVIRKVITQPHLYKSTCSKAAISYSSFSTWKESADLFEQILQKTYTH